MTTDDEIDGVIDEGAVSRRSFVKRTTLAAALFVGFPTDWSEAQEKAAGRSAIVAALGDTLIPSAPRDPGYKDLEPHGITEEVLKGLSSLDDATLEAFDDGSKKLFGGKTFVDLTPLQRAEYLKAVIAGDRFKDEAETLTKAQAVYGAVRLQVMTVYYQNYPENRVPKDKNGIPLPSVVDAHGIVNPNTTKLVTGWDVAGYPGPVRWEEEEQLRARMKKISWEGE
jgi:hypothetical protein